VNARRLGVPRALWTTLLLLTACERQAEAPPPAPAERPPASAATPTPQAEALPFYVGRWAARPELCADGAWRITERGIDTAGEVSCRFLAPPAGPGPVEVDATCTAEGPPKRWRLRLAYAQSAQALLIENGPFTDIGLIRCPAPAKP
jgi:hypothetical protein